MATVFLAIQESLDREVAIKVMDPKMADDASFCDRFLKEGKIVAQLSNHPDIVTVYDIGRSGDHYYMAMEYIPGPNLKDRIYNNDNPKQPLLVLRQVASALEMAHSKGFIHRDVKPANILFKENGDAVLSDFGIAKAVQADTQLTAIGYAVGTPEYMSPEQAMGQAVDARADLYCLGVVLYEMLAEKKPYVGQDPFSTALMHINNPIPDLPVEWATYQPLLNSLMAKDREKRFQSAEQVIQEIDGYLINATQAATAVALSKANNHAVSAADKKTLSRNSRTPLYASLGGVMILALSGAGYYFLNGPSVVNSTGEKKILISKPVAKVLNEQEQKNVIRLLEVAEAHMSIGRYKQPPGSNAMETFEMILEIDPENPTAREGLQSIQSQ